MTPSSSDPARARARRSLVLLLPAFLLGVGLSAQWQAQSGRLSLAARYQFPLAEAAADLQREQEGLKTQVVALRSKLDLIQSQGANVGGQAAALQTEIDRLKSVAGLTPRAGAGVTVMLDDARLPAGTPIRTLEAGIIHSQDITDVLNAAWKAGAEAISVNGERITTASACVGAVIQINGTLLSPPFVTSVLGPRDQLYVALSDPGELRDLKRRRDVFGVGLTIERTDDLRIPAYSGPLNSRYARVTG